MPKAKKPAKKSARKTAKTPTRNTPASRRPAAPHGAPRARLAEAALELLRTTAWHALRLSGVARSARVPLSELIGLCPSKAVLFELVLEHLSGRAADLYVPEPGTGHDRLFEVAMSWFEALGPHKAAVAALHEGLSRDPAMLFAARRSIAAAAAFLLALAEADDGPALPLRALGFAAVLGRAVPVWLKDDADLTKTMARLDTDLSRGESLLRFGGLRRKAAEEDEDLEN